MATIKFDSNSLTSLTMREYDSQYQMISLDELWQDEQKSLIQFMGLLGQVLTNDGVIDEKSILLTRSKDGVLDVVYGPCIFKNEENQIVLKFGSNIALVSQEKNEFRCGKLVGELQWGEAKEITIKNNEGQEAPVIVQKCEISFLPIDDEIENDFIVDVRLDITKNATATNIKRASRQQGSSLTDFLQLPPSGGSNEALKMRNLEPGEYEISRIEELERNRYGIPYLIHTKSGLAIWAQGNAKKALDAGFRPKEGAALTLLISRIEEGSDGKVYVENALLPRAPKKAEPSISEGQKASA